MACTLVSFAVCLLMALMLSAWQNQGHSVYKTVAFSLGHPTILVNLKTDWWHTIKADGEQLSQKQHEIVLVLLLIIISLICSWKQSASTAVPG